MLCCQLSWFAHSTFTNDSKCHLQSPCSCHPRAGPRTYVPACAHAHTLAHTRVHTHPFPGSTQEADSGEVSRGRPPREGWCRAPLPHQRCHCGRRVPRPQRKLLVAAGVPQTLRPRRLPFRGEASVPLTARVSPEPRNLNRGRRGGRGGSFLTLSVAIPTGLRAAESGWGALPFLKGLPAFPGAGALEQRLSPENSKEAHARPRGAPQTLRAPRPDLPARPAPARRWKRPAAAAAPPRAAR